MSLFFHQKEDLYTNSTLFFRYCRDRGLYKINCTPGVDDLLHARDEEDILSHVLSVALGMLSPVWGSQLDAATAALFSRFLAPSTRPATIVALIAQTCLQSAYGMSAGLQSTIRKSPTDLRWTDHDLDKVQAELAILRQMNRRIMEEAQVRHDRDVDRQLKQSSRKV